MRMLHFLSLFIKDRRGATAIEYALMVAAFTLAIVAVVFTMGDELVEMTDDIIGFIQGRETMS
ncbi:MAG: Flp family type IVb pilin [Alphaproteobacteria bacterium]|jgi:Flp pilus assembly pilin Flp